MSLLLALALAAAPQWLGPKPKLPVQRVVTLAPSLTETVLALGAGARLVGVSRFDERDEVKALPRVGGFVDPNVEAVAALKPDLFVVQKAPGNQGPVETLAQLGVPVLALPLTSVQDALDATLELGRALGEEAKAAALVRDFTGVRARVRAEAKALYGGEKGRGGSSGPLTPSPATMRGAGSVEGAALTTRPPLARPRVLLAYGFSPLVVAGPGSFADELLTDCGAVNLAEKAPTAYPVYSLERAVALAPDLVINAADSMEGRDQVGSLPQLKRARWVTLPTKDLLHPGPALGRALEGVCALVRPGGARDAGP